MPKTLLVLPPAAEDNGSNNVAYIASLSISALIALITGLWKGWFSWYTWRKENLNTQKKDLENGKPDIPPVDVPVDDSSTTYINNHSTKITGKEIYISNVSFNFGTSQTDKYRCHHELPGSCQNSAVLTLSPGLYYFNPSMARFNIARRGAGRLCNLYLSLFTAFHYLYTGRMCGFATLTLYRDVSCPRPIISLWGISLSPLIWMHRKFL